MYGAAGASGPPLDPSGAEGRRLLREELVHREYHRSDLWNRLLGWLDRMFRGGVDAASGSSTVTALVTIALALGLAVALILLLTHVRRDRRDRHRAAEVLPGVRPSAARLRQRAEDALAAGRYADAVVDGYRALAAAQIERGRIEDRPGATAHEIAARLATTQIAHGPRITQAADLFDATRYGDRPATVDQARAVLALDEELSRLPAGAR